MKISIILPAVIFAVLIFSTGLHSQTLQDSILFRPEAELEFVHAMKLFQAGRFDTASVLFSRVNKSYPRSHRTTGAFIMGAKAYYELKDFRESIRLLKDFLDTFPQSNYAEDAHYTLALNYYRLNRYPDVASELLIVLESGKERKTFLRSQRIFENVASEFLTAQEIKDLLYFSKTERSKKLLTLHRLSRLKGQVMRFEGEYDDPPVPSLLLVFRENDAIQACFDHESERYNETTNEPSCAVCFRPEVGEEFDTAIRTMAIFLRVNMELAGLITLLNDMEEKHAGQREHRTEPSLRAA